MLPAQENAARQGYELVRVSKELLDRLEKEGSGPVHYVGFTRLDDGTIEMIFRTVELSRRGTTNAP